MDRSNTDNGCVASNDDWPPLRACCAVDAYGDAGSSFDLLEDADEEKEFLNNLEVVPCDDEWCEICITHDIAAPGFLQALQRTPARREYTNATPATIATHEDFQPTAGGGQEEAPCVESTDLHGGKPMSGIRFSRLEGRHRLLHGKTGRRTHDDGPGGLTRGLLLGRVRLERSEGKPAKHKPVYYTDFELEGEDVNYSLERAGAWDRVEHLLSHFSVTVPQTRTLRDGRVQTSYFLEPKAAILPDADIALAAYRLKTHLHKIEEKSHRRAPKLVTILKTEPPDEIRDDQLQMSMSDGVRCVPQTAVVRTMIPAAAWDCSGSRPLTIDLGCTCIISAFSTQGRHPPTRVYPQTKQDFSDLGLLDACITCTSGECSCLQQARKTYSGPRWTVLDTDARQWNRQWLQPQYVRKYELLWRADRGRRWNSLGIYKSKPLLATLISCSPLLPSRFMLTSQTSAPLLHAGVFRGNVDATSEVVHSFSTVKSGLRARYLRIIPLATQGCGAVRVGVYGRKLETGGPVAKRGGLRASSCKVTYAEDLHDGVPDMVQYTLTGPPLTADGHKKTSHYVRHGLVSCGRCRCSWCMWRNPAGARRALRREAREMTRAFIWENNCVAEDVYRGRYLESYGGA